MTLADLLNEAKAHGESPWEGYDFSKPSQAVVAADAKGKGAVLWSVGGHIRMELEEAGLSDLDDLGLEPPDELGAGVWIWVGTYSWVPGYVEGYEAPGEGYMDCKGEFRRPTDDEWAAIKDGRCPWDNEDWKIKKGSGR